MDKIKALVVDDKKVIGDMFDFTLGYRGHQIKYFDTPEAALNAVRKEDFDIVFLDIIMPYKDGVTVLEEMKELKPEMPVVMMSGYSVDEKRKKAIELGAITVMKKPFEMEDVQKVVKMALGKDI